MFRGEHTPNPFLIVFPGLFVPPSGFYSTAEAWQESCMQCLFSLCGSWMLLRTSCACVVWMNDAACAETVAAGTWACLRVRSKGALVVVSLILIAYCK